MNDLASSVATIIAVLTLIAVSAVKITGNPLYGWVGLGVLVGFLLLGISLNLRDWIRKK